MFWDKNKISQLIKNNDRAVERALVAIYNRQTFDEQATSETKHHNNVGFSAAHARIGTYLAQWIIKGNRLTGKYLEQGRKIALRYVGQLEDEVKQKTPTIR